MSPTRPPRRPATRITLVPEYRSLPLEQFLNAPPTVACDCYVEGIEREAELVEWGWQLGGCENIDHHAPVPQMARLVSSTNLALARVGARGPVDRDTAVLVTHTDCDSILSAGVVSGVLEPRPEYGRAAIAADHTGVADPIADLLQALEPLRSVADSFNALAILEGGGRLPSWAGKPLAERLEQRTVAADLAGCFVLAGGIAWAAFDEPVDGEFFPVHLPEARVIVMGYPMADRSSRWVIKLRLGLAAPPGTVLDPARLRVIDPAYGGRWNAGSTKSGGGSELAPETWAERLGERL
jgi:hypothetical protein